MTYGTPVEPNVIRFSYPQVKTCLLHGTYVGWQCPTCSTAAAPPPTVTISPVSTEDAIAAMVKAFNLIINDLREQVAERDRQIQELTEKQQTT